MLDNVGWIWLVKPSLTTSSNNVVLQETCWASLLTFLGDFWTKLEGIWLVQPFLPWPTLSNVAGG